MAPIRHIAVYHMISAVGVRAVLFCLLVACASIGKAAPAVNPFAQPEYDASPEEGADGPGQRPGPVELKLKAVMPSTERPLANINGKLLAPGDLFDGYTLVSVSTEGVLLRRGQRTLTLYLHPANTLSGSSR